MADPSFRIDGLNMISSNTLSRSMPARRKSESEARLTCSVSISLGSTANKLISATRGASSGERTVRSPKPTAQAVLMGDQSAVNKTQPQYLAFTMLSFSAAAHQQPICLTLAGGLATVTPLYGWSINCTKHKSGNQIVCCQNYIRSSNASLICTLFNAAPFRMLSETIHKLIPRSQEISLRIRPTNTPSCFAASVTAVG